MTRYVSSCFITLVVLFLWRVEDIADACVCFPQHPQQAFCNAEVGKAIWQHFTFQVRANNTQHENILWIVCGRSINDLDMIIKAIYIFSHSCLHS
jgi:hypothetical protein